LGADPCLCFHILVVSNHLFFDANRVHVRLSECHFLCRT
jgi:hypothetical protein